MFFLGKSSLQVIMLALDEMIDGGMIIECDPQQVLNLDPVSSDLNWHRFYIGGFPGGPQS